MWLPCLQSWAEELFAVQFGSWLWLGWVVGDWVFPPAVALLLGWQEIHDFFSTFFLLVLLLRVKSSAGLPRERWKIFYVSRKNHLFFKILKKKKSSELNFKAWGFLKILFLKLGEDSALQTSDLPVQTGVKKTPKLQKTPKSWGFLMSSGTKHGVVGRVWLVWGCWKP